MQMLLRICVSYSNFTNNALLHLSVNSAGNVIKTGHLIDNLC